MPCKFCWAADAVAGPLVQVAVRASQGAVPAPTEPQGVFQVATRPCRSPGQGSRTAGSMVKRPAICMAAINLN